MTGAPPTVVDPLERGDHASRPVRHTGPAARFGGLVLMREDLVPELAARLRELIECGHALVLDPRGRRGGPPVDLPVRDGLRLYGDAGLFAARTVLAVVQASIRDADGTFSVDLRGLDYLALASWAAILQGTQDFRRRGGLLRVDAGERYRRLLDMTTTVGADRINLELV